MTSVFDVLIVGSGHGGAHTAILLRKNGFEGSIAIVSADASLPYERPPLSKDYLSGEMDFDRIQMRPASFWDERSVALLLGRRVVGIDPGSRTVSLEAGATLGYNTLVWAAGGRARMLQCPGSDKTGIHSIRSRSDIDLFRAQLASARRVVVIGGGYVGLETAAVLTKLGKEVALVHSRERLLSRVASEPVSRFLEQIHRSNGVTLRLEAEVEAFIGTEDAVEGVRLASGETLAADLVTIGIGMVPNVEPLISAGAAGKNGVDVDQHCRTSLDAIYAIGDCAAHLNRFAGERSVRLECVQNAVDQAAVVAGMISGKPAPYSALPWFWSNQYDVKLQSIGLTDCHDDVVLRGDPKAEGFSVAYLADQRLVAMECVNRPRDYVQARALILGGMPQDRQHLANPDIPLKQLAS
jgi:3-phenylpropionate/trans-cinnamate dioxygenase ferredoxin reductase component